MSSDKPQSEVTPKAPWRISVDVGGTFTDMALADAEGTVQVFKVPSVPEDPSQGVLAALDKAATTCGLDQSELLQNCSLFMHGSTVATNTMVERKGAKVGLLTTEGFRDSLEIRRGIRENQWDHRQPFPPVLAPRYLRLPVRGRIERDGTESTPLEPADVKAAATTFAEEGVESVAIGLINSFLNPAHEKACEAILRESWDGEWISVSSDIVPIMGEYERVSTAVVNAYLAPPIMPYLRNLDERLRELGLKSPLLLGQSNGGMASVNQVAQRPVSLVLSGPAAGVGALNLYGRSAGTNNLISMEIGGTSCDVTLMGEGAVPVVDSLMVEGYHLAMPAVDIHTIGAGGGTVAGVDEAGMLFVGPYGAGARPGPACYGLGGTEPTVTDAQLVLGRLRPGPLADGSVALDEGLGRTAIERAVAAPLGIDADAAAAGVVRLVEQNLLHAVERISIERGHNPRRFTLVAAGGAGPMHGAIVGRALGCWRVYTPRQAGAFCAIGMLHSDVRQDYQQVFLAELEGADQGEVDQRFKELEERARAALLSEGFKEGAIRLEREFDLRYRGQQWPVRVAMGETTTFDPAAVKAAFESEHDRLYGHIQPSGTVEITELRVAGLGLLDPLKLAAGIQAKEASAPFEHRPVYINEQLGKVEIPIYAGADLHVGQRLAGPLLVEEQTTTVFVGPDDVLEVDPSNNYVIHLEQEEERRVA